MGNRMYFVRLWTISALASLVAMLVVLAVWLLADLGFDEETVSLILSYVSNARLLLLAVAVSALIGLVEAVVMTSLYRRRSKRT
jgi:hypothetical protein